MRFNVTDNRIRTVEAEMMTSGSVNVYRAQFSFDASWDGWQKTAVFTSQTERREVALLTDECLIPWEVLQNGSAFSVGVYGVQDDRRRTTVPTGRLQVTDGTAPAPAAETPTPTVYEQLLQLGTQASADAADVKRRADAGEFNGYTPRRGVDYWTPAEVQNMQTTCLQRFQPGLPLLMTASEYQAAESAQLIEKNRIYYVVDDKDLSDGPFACVPIIVTAEEYASLIDAEALRSDCIYYVTGGDVL